FSRRRRHTRFSRDWSSDVCSSDLGHGGAIRTTSGPVTVIGSTLAGNFTAGTNADGGAISTDTAPVILVDSTLHDNATLGDAEARSEERRVGKEWRPRGRRRQTEQS